MVTWVGCHFKSKNAKPAKMVVFPVVTDMVCSCCNWTNDEYNPNQWQMFAPWNAHLLCATCRQLMAGFEAEEAAEAEETDAEIPVDVAEGVEDADEIELAITVDNDGNVLSVSVIPHVPSAEGDVVDLTSDSDESDVATP